MSDLAISGHLITCTCIWCTQERVDSAIYTRAVALPEPHTPTHERIQIIDLALAHAHRMYERGRSDRVFGIAPQTRYADDMYYARGYKTEQTKETVAL